MRQKGTSQILNIFIIPIELKSHVTSVLKYHNEVFFNVLYEEVRSIKLIQNMFNMV